MGNAPITIFNCSCYPSHDTQDGGNQRGRFRRVIARWRIRNRIVRTSNDPNWSTDNIDI